MGVNMNLPLNIDFRQILLHMLNFVILAFSMYFILYKPVKEFMEKRRNMYEEMDSEAKNKLSAAENAKKEYEEKLALSDEEIRKKMTESEIKANKDAAEIIDKAKKDAEELLIKARKQSEYEAKESVRRANREISQMAVMATKKIVFGDTNEAFDAFLENVEGDADGGEE